MPPNDNASGLSAAEMQRLISPISWETEEEVEDAEEDNGAVEAEAEADSMFGGVECASDGFDAIEYQSIAPSISRSGRRYGMLSGMPSFYGEGVNSANLTFCSHCRNHFDVSEVKEISGLKLCHACASKYKLPCHSCGAKVKYRKASNFLFTNGSFYCTACIETCKHCNTLAPSHSMTSVGGSRYCKACHDRKYFRCGDCGKSYPLSEEMRIDGGYIVCESCFEDNYFCCDECETTYPNSYHQRDGMCQRCARLTGHVHTCDYKPETLFYGNGLMMGIELEIDKKRGEEDLFECATELHSMSDGEQRFYLKEDGSLSNGLEIVSHPMSLEVHKKYDWQKVFRTCVTHGFNSHNTKTCGLHVHISRKYMSFLDCVRLGMFVAFNKDKFEALSRRKENYDYAKFKKIHKGELKQAGRSEDGRYEAINWTNLGTIEFRMFKGTLLPETFIATLELVHAVAHFVKTVNTNQIYGTKERKSWSLFCDFVSKDRRNYKNLLAFMREKGVR